jgi:GNAT superfamily N-acetyltransferase
MTLSAAIHQERPDTTTARQLIGELEAALEPLYPRASRHGYSVDQLLQQDVAFFVTYHEGLPAGCGGLQLFGTDYAELKRMYVRPSFRSLGLATLMLDALIQYARQHGVSVLRLETGIHQLEAIRLYERYGFLSCGPFGSYQPDPLSLFFELHLP